MRKIRLGISAVNPHDQCAFYRSTGPWSDIARFNENVEVIWITEFKWATLYGLDAIFISRPAHEIHYDAMVLAAQMNKSVWIDYDDDLFHVPWDNTESYKYNNKKMNTLLSSIASLASLITVSTKELETLYKPFKRPVKIIPNAWDFKTFSYPLKQPEIKKNVIAWRGSPTHTQDLITVKDALLKFGKEFKEAEFHFFGFMPWMLMPDLGPQIKYQTIPMVSFNSYLWGLHPKILIAPLKDSRFNRCKSNIAWLEGTHAGAACLGSDLPEWRKNGLARASTSDEFYELLKKLYTNDEFCFDNFIMSSEYIKENLSLEKQNKKRFELLLELLG